MEDIAVAPSLGPGGPIPEEKKFPRKVFAKPFRLVFKRVEDQTITWLEVKSLDGLRNVVRKLSEGEIVPVDAYSTLDRQLWGHLAEYLGFIRYQGPADDFSGGIQPAGPEFSELTSDLSAILGGQDEVLTALSSFREQIMKEMEGRLPIGNEEVPHDYVQPDNVNLTPRGEEILADLVDEDPLPDMFDAIEAARGAEVDVREDQTGEQEAPTETER